MYQYRITVNGTQSQITDVYPAEQWSRCFDHIEARGGHCQFERRLITDEDILPLLLDSRGYIKLGDGRVVCPWEIIAEGEVR